MKNSYLMEKVSHKESAWSTRFSSLVQYTPSPARAQRPGSCLLLSGICAARQLSGGFPAFNYQHDQPASALKVLNTTQVGLARVLL